METKLKIQSYGTQFNAPEGYMLNGKIVPSVASNNLTVAIKTLSGNDATAANPIIIRIGDTVHSITGALSVTKNAGTNWFNAGSAELATKEIDYFVYLGYNATDGVVIGFSRIPYVTDYSQFSATSNNEKYCAISTITNAASGDDYTVVGRFAATLSAGTGYTWTVPTFTTINLIQRPIFETRLLDWVPTLTGGNADLSGYDYAKYKFSSSIISLLFAAISKNVTGSSGVIKISIPYTRPNISYIDTMMIHNGSTYGATMLDFNASAAIIDVYKTTALGNWVANETNVRVYFEHTDLLL